MKKILVLALVSILVSANANAFSIADIYTGSNVPFNADCRHIALNDHFPIPSLWQSQGNGDVNVSGGQCNFVNAYEGSYNRVYRSIGVTLSDTCWWATCDFNVLSQNPSGHGGHAIVMALTAGTLNFMTYDGSQGFAETNQDGIAVTFGSAIPTDNNINNWYFLIQTKKGNIRTASSSFINGSSAISHYYVRLERMSQNVAKLSVFSDSLMTTHITGSPITYTIDPAITGLNTIQHGINAGGNIARYINAVVDNDFICDCDNAGNGVDEYNENNLFQIFPNPATESITVIASAQGVIASAAKQSIVSIYNIEGQLMQNNIATDSQITIDISALAKAMYFVKLQTAEGVAVRKFVKE